MSFKVFYYTCLIRYLQWLYYTRHKQHHAICIHKITTVVDPMLTIVLSHLWCISALKRGKSCGIDNLIPEVVIESSKIIHCDSIKTRIPLLNAISECVWISEDNRGIHNASCENRTLCVFPSQVWHQLIFLEAVSTGHSMYNAYVMGDHV